MIGIRLFEHACLHAAPRVVRGDYGRATGAEVGLDPGTLGFHAAVMSALQAFFGWPAANTGKLLFQINCLGRGRRTDMLSIRKLACVALVVAAAGFALPAMAARTYTVSYAYFDSTGHFVGQNLWTCENRNIVGGTVTQYSVVQSYPCYSDPNVSPSVTSTLPPGMTQDQACAILATSPYGHDVCGEAPQFAYGP